MVHWRSQTPPRKLLTMPCSATLANTYKPPLHSLISSYLVLSLPHRSICFHLHCSAAAARIATAAATGARRHPRRSRPLSSSWRRRRRPACSHSRGADGACKWSWGLPARPRLPAAAAGPRPPRRKSSAHKAWRWRPALDAAAGRHGGGRLGMRMRARRGGGRGGGTPARDADAGETRRRPARDAAAGEAWRRPARDAPVGPGEARRRLACFFPRKL